MRAWSILHGHGPVGPWNAPWTRARQVYGRWLSHGTWQHGRSRVYAPPPDRRGLAGYLFGRTVTTPYAQSGARPYATGLPGSYHEGDAVP
jgi:hypothetical protein